MVFIDLQKAYETMLTDEIWRNMREKGVPEKYVRFVMNKEERITKTSVGMTEDYYWQQSNCTRGLP